MAMIYHTCIQNEEQTKKEKKMRSSLVARVTGCYDHHHPFHFRSMESLAKNRQLLCILLLLL